MAKKTKTTKALTASSFIGKTCVCRATGAGVHVGLIESHVANGAGTQTVVLRNAVRLWKWKAVSGVSLSGVATAGVVRSDSKIEAIIDYMLIDGVCELIPVTAVAKESIYGAQ